MEYKKYFIDDNPNGNRCREKWIKVNNGDLYYKIIDWTSHIPDIPFIERIWYFINNKKDIVKCGCGNPTKYQDSLILGFREFCSRNCPYKISLCLERSKKTCQDKYGFDYSQQNAEIKEKRNKIIYDKYGVTSTAKLGWVKEKYKKTCQEKYGVDSHVKNDGVKIKIKKTNNEKYGFDNPNKNKIIKDKIEQTNLKKYGVKTTLLDPKTQEKIKETLLKNYGVDNVFKSDKIKESIKEHSIKKYFNKHQDIPFVKGKCVLNSWVIKCDECGNESTLNANLLNQRFYMYKTRLCLSCNPINKGSESETNLQNFISSLDVNCDINNRTILNGKEIDIYLPDYNIGIEYDGLYWHSEECGKDRQYHITKTKLANEKGVKLIHIFEDEWLNNPEIVKSRILNLLNKTPNKIYGRKCIIKELTNNECKEFLNDNHLQGYTPATHNIGLFYNNELVSLMTFGKRKITGKNSLELIRFCNKINTNVIGSASKLFKYYIEKYKPEELISYADIRWSGLNENSTIYNKLGFKLKHISQPNYWYVKGVIKYHRYNFRKDKLVKDGFNQTKTEREIMIERGYNKIWDCGNLVFTLNQSLSKVYTENINKNTVISEDVIKSIDNFLI